MIYTKLTKLAMSIAYKAHHGQTDKTGVPYILHPIHLAEQMIDEDTTCLALLHDVVEDTPVDFEDLKQAGFPDHIINALKLLTHDNTEPYMDYVRKIKTNNIAKTVKLADLIHNSDISRLDVLDDKAKQRNEKYKRAIEILTE